jgi:hypothetical protein
MRFWRPLVLTASIVALVLQVPPPATAAVQEQQWFWRWSDGSTASQRTLAEARYSSQSRLPLLVVTVRPAMTGQTVLLQFRDRTGWHDDDVGTTDGRGRVRLELNPYCPDGAWCRQTFDYRLVAGRSKAALSVRFIP